METALGQRIGSFWEKGSWEYLEWPLHCQNPELLPENEGLDLAPRPQQGFGASSARGHFENTIELVLRKFTPGVSVVECKGGKEEVLAKAWPLIFRQGGFAVLVCIHANNPWAPSSHLAPSWQNQLVQKEIGESFLPSQVLYWRVVWTLPGRHPVLPFSAAYWYFLF